MNPQQVSLNDVVTQARWLRPQPNAECVNCHEKNISAYDTKSNDRWMEGSWLCESCVDSILFDYLQRRGDIA